MSIFTDIEDFNSLDNNKKLSYMKALKKSLPISIINTYFAEIVDSKTTSDSNWFGVKEISAKELDTAHYLFGKNHYKDSNDLYIFKNMVITLALLEQAIIKIKEVLDVEIEVALVGGSLRDLILNQRDLIKDLDIVVSIGEIKGLTHPLLEEEDFNIKVLSLEDLEKTENLKDVKELKENKFIHSDVLEKNSNKITSLLKINNFFYNIEIQTSFSDQFIYYILKELIGKEFKIKKEYPPRVLPEEMNNSELLRCSYYNTMLSGVIKLNCEKAFSYPVDILLTRHGVDNYLKTFDFEICKIFLLFTEENREVLESVLINFTQDKLENLFDMIEVKAGFIKDVSNKTLTFNAEGFDLKAIEHALHSHYPRLKEKYPEYTLTVGNVENINIDALNYLEKFSLVEKLDKITKEKPVEIKKTIKKI